MNKRVSMRWKLEDTTDGRGLWFAQDGNLSLSVTETAQGEVKWAVEKVYSRQHQERLSGGTSGSVADAMSAAENAVSRFG